MSTIRDVLPPGGRRRLANLILRVAGVVCLGLSSLLAAPGSPAAAQADAVLEIEIAGADGSGVASAYVAVVPETAPWAQPSREAVLDEPVTRWRLAPDRYRTVVVAPGHLVHYGPVLDLRAGGHVEERIVLETMTFVEGRVVDRSGEPISRARVTDLRQLVHDLSRRLSPLGENRARQIYETRTGDDGEFRLPFHPRGGHYLAVLAEGHEPRFFANLRLPEAREAFDPLVLEPGTRLEVVWHETGSSTAPYDRIQLLPVGDGFPRGLDLSSALAVWARPLTGGGAVWSALPPGRYELWLKAPPRGAHSAVPVRVGAVSLEAGASGDLRIEIPELPAAEASSAPRNPESLRILLPAMPSDERDGLRVRTAKAGRALEERSFDLRRASGGPLLEIAGDCRPGSRGLVVTERRLGTWTVPAGSACSEGAEPLRVELLPRADLDLRLTAPPGSELPEHVEIASEPCLTARRSGSAPFRAALSIRLEPAGERSARLRAPVPAGCVALTVSAGEFAPLAWPEVELPTQGRLDLGSHRLRTGAAVLVRVLSTQDFRPVDGVAVHAVFAPRAAEILEVAARNPDSRALPDPGAVTSNGGWARLYGLEPRADLVVLLDAPDRRVPYAAAEIRLAAGEERVLDALELPPPTTLEIGVELSRTLEDLEVVPYQLSLTKLRGSGPAFSVMQEIGPERTVRFADLPAGTWRYQGIVRGADGKPFPAGSGEIELRPGESRSVDVTFADSVYRGRVTFEGLPVQGSMSISPVDPADRRGMSVLLDEDGRFRLPLEGPGTYTLRVYDERERRFDDATIAAFEFEDPDEEVWIRVPEGRIGGRVIDGEGQPVAGARIRFDSRQPLPDERFRHVETVARADGEGRFSIEALAEAIWTITASSENGRSAPELVELRTGERLAGVELVTPPTAAVEGTVRDAAGVPVAGARLHVTPRPTRPAEVPPFESAITDEDGRFALQSVDVGQIVNLAFTTPEGRVGALVVEVTEDVRVVLPVASGPVEVELPCSRHPAHVSGVRFLVASSGAYLPLPRLGRAERISRNPCRTLQRTPGLAAGEWRIVRVRTVAEEAILLAGGGSALAAEAILIARPGSAVRARVDEERPGSSHRFESSQKEIP